MGVESDQKTNHSDFGGYMVQNLWTTFMERWAKPKDRLLQYDGIGQMCSTVLDEGLRSQDSITSDYSHTLIKQDSDLK